jgi:hypothetical protein
MLVFKYTYISSETVMKSVISRNKILRFVILLVILLGVIVLYYLYKEGVILQVEKENYSKVLETCGIDEIDNKNKPCVLLIREIIEDEQKECFDVRVFTPDYNLKNYTFCVDKSLISWEDRVEVLENELVPVYADFQYQRNMFFEYNFKGLSLALMPDEEIYGVIDKLSENRLPLPNIRTEKFTEIVQKGYYLDNHFHEIVDGKRISSLTFYFVEVEKVSNKGNKIVISGRVEILDNEYNFEVEADSFLYVPVDFSYNENSTIISSDNLDDYPKREGSFQMRYYYIGSEEEINEDDIFNYCTQEDLTLRSKVFCDNIVNNKFSEINTIEDYIIQITENNATLDFNELTLINLFQMYEE